MKRIVCATIAMLTLSALLGACGGGGGSGGGGAGGGGGGYGGPPPPPPAPPPPPPAQSPGGVWNGLSAAQAAPDVFTSFETDDAVGPFATGVAPYQAFFSSGIAEFRGIQEFYIPPGTKAWHITGGSMATVTFETMPHTLSFWVRTENASDVALIEILDETGDELQTIVPTNSYELITENRYPGETVIGSVVFTSTSSGDIVSDAWTYGFLELDALIACVIDEPTAAASEFICVLTDPALDEVVSSAQGTIQVANGDQASGSGTLYAIPPFTLSDGLSTVAALTVTGGIVNEAVELVLNMSAAGETVTLVMDYDANSYDRGSDLATVAGNYMFDFYGDTSTFDIDQGGLILGISISGCILSGQVSIIDAAFNSYDVELDVTMCGGLDGMYSGMGTTQDLNGTDDLFLFAVFNATGTITGEAVKVVP